MKAAIERIKKILVRLEELERDPINHVFGVEWEDALNSTLTIIEFLLAD